MDNGSPHRMHRRPAGWRRTGRVLPRIGCGSGEWAFCKLGLLPPKAGAADGFPRTRQSHAHRSPPKRVRDTLGAVSYPYATLRPPPSRTTSRRSPLVRAPHHLAVQLLRRPPPLGRDLLLQGDRVERVVEPHPELHHYTHLGHVAHLLCDQVWV